MRTRRSPRNQDRLWNELGGPAPAPRAPRTIEERIASEQRVLDDPFQSRSSKALARRNIERLRKALSATTEQPSCGQDAGDARDAARYRIVRRKVGIVSGKTPEFVIMNLRPVHIGPDAAIELDAAIDAAIAAQQQGGAP